MSDQDSSKGDEPEDPSGILSREVMPPLDAMTVQLNEVYESLQRAGFSPIEALQMVTGLLTTMIQYVPMIPGMQDDDNDEDQDYSDEDDDDDEDFWNGLQDRL